MKSSQAKMVTPKSDPVFTPGQTVSVRDYRGETKRIPGVIQQQTGPVSYKVEISPNTTWRRHSDQLRDSNFNQPAAQICEPTLPDIDIPEHQITPSVVNPPVPVNPPGRRYPVRARKAPDRLNL